jgi:uncharacterized protein
MTSMRSINAFLEQPAIAIVGASRSGKKFGNVAARELRQNGYRVLLVHWSGATIDGARSYQRIGALPEAVKSVLIVVPPSQAMDVVRDAAAAGVQHVWLQQGAESAEAVALCGELGLDVVSGECILMFAKPTGVHKFHRWINRVTRRLPAA